MLHRHWLEVQRDYTMIEAPFPTHKAMLKEHKGDLVVGVLPFSYDPATVADSGGVPLHPGAARAYRDAGLLS